MLCACVWLGRCRCGGCRLGRRGGWREKLKGLEKGGGGEWRGGRGTRRWDGGELGGERWRKMKK